jgi:hypothetical protein
VTRGIENPPEVPPCPRGDEVYQEVVTRTAKAASSSLEKLELCRFKILTLAIWSAPRFRTNPKFGIPAPILSQKLHLPMTGGPSCNWVRDGKE